MNLDFLIEWALCPGEGVSRHEPTPKAFLDLEDILNHVTSRLENYVGRRPNIPQVTVAGPPTQNLDNVVRALARATEVAAPIRKLWLELFPGTLAALRIARSQAFTMEGQRGVPLAHINKELVVDPRMVRY